MKCSIWHFVTTFLSLLPLVFLLSLTSLSFDADAFDEASFAITEADNKLKMAFENVLEAERLGANVSDLIDRLNEAVRLLAEAESAYKIGDFNKAIAMTAECSMLAAGVVNEASNLRERAIVNAQTIFWRNLAVSILGATAFLVSLFFAWSLFKRYYVKRILNMKLEVSLNVED